MAVTSVGLFEENMARTLEQGAIIYDLERIYWAKTDTASDGPSTVVSSSLLPQLGDNAVIAATGAKVYVDHQGKAFRPAGVDKQTFWHIPYRYTNRSAQGDPNSGLPVGTDGQHVQDPTEAPAEVGITYHFEHVSPTNSKFEGVFLKRENHPTKYFQVSNPPILDNWAGGPVTTSLEELEDVKVRRTQTSYTYSKVVATWNEAWGDLIDRVNDGPVTMTEHTGFAKTFDPGQLLLHNVRKQNLWIGGTLYYRRVYDLLYNQQGHHIERIDYGTRRYIFEGQFKHPASTGNTDQWTAAEVEKLGGYPFTGFPAVGGRIDVPASILNGYGQEIGMNRPGIQWQSGAFVVRWAIHPEADFGPLEIS